MSQFALNISAFAKQANASLEGTVRAIKINLFSGVIMDTRVDTGRLRGNWQTTTGSPASGEIARLDPSGVSTVSDVRSGVTPDGVDYLTNNLPYAEVWEDRDGMVAKNAARIAQIVRSAKP